MNDTTTSVRRTGVWFVYDGDCPICSMAASALRIRQEYGSLHLVDARTDLGEPLLHEIQTRNFNLDEGMVIWCDNQFYHGEDALLFMARFGEDKGWFNRLNRRLFQSERFARFCYPWMRAGRNLLIKIRGVGKIDNLRNEDDPVFKSVFGASWEELPHVMKRHYANRPYRHDIATVEGTLRVESSPLGRFFNPLFRLTGTLVPYEGDNVPVTVNFITNVDSNAFWFDRTFHFPGKAPYRFRSQMLPMGGNDMVELMGPGMGWRSAFSWDGEKVMLAHKGYVIRLFGIMIPVPLTFLLGAGYAEEIALDENTFSMMTEIRHPLWGKVFGYDGTFKVTKDA